MTDVFSESPGARFNYTPLDDEALEVYPHQIGGHGLNQKKSSVLYSKTECEVFKPLQKYPKGQNEINLYNRVFADDCSDPILLALRNFVPLFKGVYFRSTNQSFYFGMNDLLHGLNYPSICDIKMGQRTFTPDASAEKIAIEQAKYKWQTELGFAITGMKIHTEENEGPLYFDRTYGRSLTPTMVYDEGIRLFLGPHTHRANVLARAFHVRLTDLAAWFGKQRQIAFYASSILLAYDGNALSQDDNVPDFRFVRVALIDFTRWCPLDGSSKDDNFVYGLDNLLTLFNRASSDRRSYRSAFLDSKKLYQTNRISSSFKRTSSHLVSETT